MKYMNQYYSCAPPTDLVLHIKLLTTTCYNLCLYLLIKYNCPILGIFWVCVLHKSPSTMSCMTHLHVNRFMYNVYQYPIQHFSFSATTSVLSRTRYRSVLASMQFTPCVYVIFVNQIFLYNMHVL